MKYVKNGYVGSMIWHARNMRGMTEKELGLKAGFNRFTAERKIILCERNRKILKEKDMKRIAKALNVHPLVFRNELPSHENSFIMFRKFKDDVYIKFYSFFISELLKEWDIQLKRYNNDEITYKEYVQWLMSLPDRMPKYELDAQV